MMIHISHDPWREYYGIPTYIWKGSHNPTERIYNQHACPGMVLQVTPKSLPCKSRAKRAGGLMIRRSRDFPMLLAGSEFGWHALPRVNSINPVKRITEKKGLAWNC